MIKNFTYSNYISNFPNDEKNIDSLQTMLTVNSNLLMKAPPKSVNFVKDFIKVYITKRLKNGTYAEIVVN